MEVMATKRRATQPRDASAGCVFRNPPADKAGRLIEMSGLKGDVQGGAKVSPIHANFIVNTGEATAADILLLLRRVRGVVKAERGIELEPEIIALGKEWRDLL
jgi:UDP-N-acetylenolpyruvoylglucosamine reductase